MYSGLIYLCVFFLVFGILFIIYSKNPQLMKPVEEADKKNKMAIFIVIMALGLIIIKIQVWGRLSTPSPIQLTGFLIALIVSIGILVRFWKNNI